MELAVKTKACPRCGETKPLSEFYVVKGKVRSWCKPCTRESQRERMALVRATPEGAEANRQGRRKSYAKHGRSISALAAERALARLKERRRREYDALYRLAYDEERRRREAEGP